MNKLACYTYRVLSICTPFSRTGACFILFSGNHIVLSLFSSEMGGTLLLLDTLRALKY